MIVNGKKHKEEVMTDSNNRGHELEQKIGDLEQRRIKMIKEVDQ